MDQKLNLIARVSALFVVRSVATIKATGVAVTCRVYIVLNTFRISIYTQLYSYL